MNFLSILLASVTAIFALAWAYIAWLKVHEHHREITDEHRHHYKTHVTWPGLFQSSKRDDQPQFKTRPTATPRSNSSGSDPARTALGPK